MEDLQRQGYQTLSILPEAKSFPTADFSKKYAAFTALDWPLSVLEGRKYLSSAVSFAIDFLSKKDKNVKASLLTKNISKTFALDVKKANEQYVNFVIQNFEKSHDRFLIIDNTTVYHLGASLKDLGKKWFAFTKMNTESVESILNALKEDN